MGWGSRIVGSIESWADFDPFEAELDELRERVQAAEKLAEVRGESARFIAGVLSHECDVWEARARAHGWQEPPESVEE